MAAVEGALSDGGSEAPRGCGEEVPIASPISTAGTPPRGDVAAGAPRGDVGDPGGEREGEEPRMEERVRESELRVRNRNPAAATCSSITSALLQG